MQAAQSTPNTSTEVVNTLYLNMNDPSTPPLNLHQSLPTHLTTYDKTIFPRTPTPLFSNTSAGVPLSRMTFQTQLQSHQPQIATFEPPILPKATNVKPSTVSMQLNPTSVPIIRPKPSIPTSSLTAIFTKATPTNLSQPYTVP